MKSRNRLLGAAILTAAIVGAWIYWHDSSGQNQGAAPHKNAATESVKPVPDEQKPVGWVFGRLMNVPGAERPFTSSVGPKGRPLPSPSRRPNGNFPPGSARPSLIEERFGIFSDNVIEKTDRELS